MGNINLVIASNRGPLTNNAVNAAGSGGLIQTLLSAIKNREVIWVAAQQATGEQLKNTNFQIVFPEIDNTTYDLSYNVISNSILWFIHHHMINPDQFMIFDNSFYDAWRCYQEYNKAFATTIAENAPVNATVVINDYHLCLAPFELKKLRKDLKIIHFSHTPFASPSIFKILPEPIAQDILNGIASADFSGFHVPKWSKSFLQCAHEFNVLPKNVFSYPVGIDPDHLDYLKNLDSVSDKCKEIKSLTEEKVLIVRIDRLEPAKNLLRGIISYEMLLRRNPTLTKDVFHLVLVNPSREGLQPYSDYKEKVLELSDKVKRLFPESFELKFIDDIELSVAAMKCADIMLVNPVRDGLNLVAKEASYINENLILILSKEAGCFYQLNKGAFGINPYDIKELSYMLESAIFLDQDERSRRAHLLKESCVNPTATQWLNYLINLTKTN